MGLADQVALADDRPPPELVIAGVAGTPAGGQNRLNGLPVERAVGLLQLQQVVVL